MKVLYINTELDTRSDNAFSTHNHTIGKIPFDAIKTDRLNNLEIKNYDVVAVDEAQFFPDLKDTVLAWVEKDKKIVIVAGLNGDFRRNQFGQILDLIPYSDNVIKLASFCMSCKQEKNTVKQAHFTKRIIQGNQEILIGGKDAYIPVCRECFLK
jgi:thymidine kinase